MEAYKQEFIEFFAVVSLKARNVPDFLYFRSIDGYFDNNVPIVTYRKLS